MAPPRGSSSACRLAGSATEGDSARSGLPARKSQGSRTPSGRRFRPLPIELRRRLRESQHQRNERTTSGRGCWLEAGGPIHPGAASGSIPTAASTGRSSFRIRPFGRAKTRLGFRPSVLLRAVDYDSKLAAASGCNAARWCVQSGAASAAVPASPRSAFKLLVS